jgi:hypothetical protein
MMNQALNSVTIQSPRLFIIHRIHVFILRKDATPFGVASFHTF